MSLHHSVASIRMLPMYLYGIHVAEIEFHSFQVFVRVS